MDRTPFDFDGRIALVTGCGSPSGIGFAVARMLARGGARVAITSTTGRIRERTIELKGEGLLVSGHVADLTDPQQSADLLREVLEEHGRLDVLVNNAGMVQTGVEDRARPFLEMDEVDWQQALRLNLDTAVHLTRVVAPHMAGNGYGRIINVSSVTGPLTAIMGESGYAAAKAGMEGLTRALALELGPHGITVNSVAPGWIATDSSPPAELSAGRFTPVGRPGRPDEVAAAVLFLSSEAASYVNGHSLVVDGGNVLQEHKGAEGR